MKLNHLPEWEYIYFSGGGGDKESLSSSTYWRPYLNWGHCDACDSFAERIWKEWVVSRWGQVTFPSSCAHFPFVPWLSITEQLDCPCRGGNAIQVAHGQHHLPRSLNWAHPWILFESYLRSHHVKPWITSSPLITVPRQPKIFVKNTVLLSFQYLPPMNNGNEAVNSKKTFSYYARASLGTS